MSTVMNRKIKEAFSTGKNRVKNIIYSNTFIKNVYPFLPPLPLSMVNVAIELTNSCNLRCLQCHYQGTYNKNYKRKIGFMDFSLFKKIIDELAKEGCQSIMHNADGEATLHPEFLTFLEYASNKGLKIHFNTNGLTFNKKFTDQLLLFYKGSVNFSLDGFKKSHERIRVGSKYEKVIEHLEYFLDARKFSDNKNIRIGVSYCKYDQPENELEQFVDHWLKIVDVVTTCITFDEQTRVTTNVSHINHEGKKVCVIPFNNFEISHEGNIIPCSSYMSCATQECGIFGNVMNNTIREVWHGKEIRNFKQKLLNNNLDGMICKNCERWKLFDSLPDKFNNGTRITSNGVFKSYTNLS